MWQTWALREFKRDLPLDEIWVKPCPTTSQVVDLGKRQADTEAKMSGDHSGTWPVCPEGRLEGVSRCEGFSAEDELTMYDKTVDKERSEDFSEGPIHTCEYSRGDREPA